jgi:type II secretory pathway component GspD/PulD (secretin)
MPVQLRAQIVVIRYQGDRKIGSVPYSFLLTSDKTPVSLKNGVDVPVPVFSSGTTGSSSSPAGITYQYRTVGTSIKCQAEERAEGLFQLVFEFEISSLFTRPGNNSPSGETSPPVGDQPLFRTQNFTPRLLLRDGQTSLAALSTDPMSGEVLKLEVTLNVVK